MSPTGMDVILYEYLNKLEREDFFSTAETRDSIERFVRLVYAEEYTSPAQDFERAKKALEIQL